MYNKKPYTWVPTLYFIEALPYVAVMTISTIMYKNMGLSNTELAFYTSWLYLPWVIKPLWSPFIDTIKTKRWWILSMQLMIGAGLAGVASTLPTTYWLQATIAFFWLIAFSSATHDIAADGFYILALDSHNQSMYVGIRSTFYRIATIFGQGALVIFAGWAESITKISVAWTATFLLMSGILLAAYSYHRFSLPNPEVNNIKEQKYSKHIFKEFVETLKIFFSKPQIITALLFMLLFRFPEAQLVKLVYPFMLDSMENGGMGLNTETAGLVYGTVGVIGLTLGGILGGFVAARDGLKKWLWPMVLAISLPDAVYIYLSYVQPTNIIPVHICVFIEQFGYGFGFTAYMLYLIYFSRGEKSTSVYAICTAFMALGMMLPGMIAGWIQEQIGYTNFFIWVTVSCIITAIVSLLLKIDPEFGKKNKD